MPRAVRGVLVECDPSIKSLIVKLDSEGNDYIIEDLDDQHLVIHEKMVAVLKGKLTDALKETQQDEPESGSD